MPRNSHGKAAFFREKESLAKKANCRAAPMSRLDRRFFEKKLCKKLSGRTPAGFFFFWGGSVLRAAALRTHPYSSVPIRTPAVAHPGISSSSRRSVVAA